MKVLAKHTHCPVCGSESRVLEDRAAVEIAAGKLPAEFKTGALITQTPMFSPNYGSIVASREVPAIMGLYDVCSDCGNMYAVEMIEHTMLVAPSINPSQKTDGNGGRHPWIA